jgi:hypothetical protein
MLAGQRCPCRGASEAQDLSRVTIAARPFSWRTSMPVLPTRSQQAVEAAEPCPHSGDYRIDQVIRTPLA